MGGIVSLILSQCACEAATCCVGLGARCCCAVTTKAVGQSTVTRAAYLFIFLLTSIVAWVLSNWAAIFIPFFPVLKEIPIELFGASSAIRVTAGLALFHLIQSVVLIGVASGRDARAMLQNSCWIIKTITLVGLVVAMFFVPNDYLEMMGKIALIGAAVFICIQLVILVDFAHSWNASWVQKWNETENDSWYYLLVGSMAALYLVASVLTAIMFSLFGTTGGCGLNAFAVALNTIACLVLSVASVSNAVQEANPRSGLLQSALVTTYATYLVFSAAMSGSSDSGGSCVALGGSAGTHTSLIVGALFTMVSVCYSALSVTRRASATEPNYISVATDIESNGKSDEDEREDEESSEDDLKKPQAVEDENESVSYSYAVFHITFAMAALYMGCLLSKWHILGMEDDMSVLTVDRGEGSWWVKVVSSWATLLIYSWTLFAPVAMPDRDFGFTAQ